MLTCFENLLCDTLPVALLATFKVNDQWIFIYIFPIPFSLKSAPRLQPCLFHFWVDYISAVGQQITLLCDVSPKPAL